MVEDFFDRPIAFHRIFVSLTGSVNAALMLSQAVYWSKRTRNPDGWFYKSGKEWEEETGLGRWEQEGARKTLRGTGIWEENLRGVPATVWYRLDFKLMQEKLLAFDNPSLRKTNKLVCGKTSNKIEEYHPTSMRKTDKHLSLSETTTENTQREPAPQASFINSIIEEAQKTGVDADSIIKRERNALTAKGKLR